jgi:acyl-CoA thioester hydrolase
MNENTDPQSESAEITIQVRYPECDPAGVAHHSVFAIWMEIARTELLRKQGVAYADLAAQGVLFVVARLSVRFRKPVFYDQTIQVRTWITASAHTKVDHAYKMYCGDNLVMTGETTLICIDHEGNVRAIPDGIM